jgi:hypothetical protein
MKPKAGSGFRGIIKIIPNQLPAESIKAGDKTGKAGDRVQG